MITILNEGMKECHCGSLHRPITIEGIAVEHGALSKISTFIHAKSYRKISIVCDQNTLKAAGETVITGLNGANLHPALCVVKENELGDVVADETSLIQTFLEIPMDTEVVLAVGAGTIHDIARFICFHKKIPFISVPTAASVDGFTSAGAPIIHRRFKQTVQTVAPIALFADLDILMKAPKELTAAGFGDILGKFTSLTDWKVSHWLANEPYCPAAAELTKTSLKTCISNINEIAADSSKGIKILIESLIESGLIMTALNHSRPASGAEHHLSHYWEMNFLQTERAQLLHGAKVGVATTIIAHLYKQISTLSLTDLNMKGKNKEMVLQYWKEIKEIYRDLPDQNLLRTWLGKVGGAATPEELGISKELIEKALDNAHLLRDRYTGLKLYNEQQLKLKNESFLSTRRPNEVK